MVIQIISGALSLARTAKGIITTAKAVKTGKRALNVLKTIGTASLITETAKKLIKDPAGLLTGLVGGYGASQINKARHNPEQIRSGVYVNRHGNDIRITPTGNIEITKPDIKRGGIIKEVIDRNRAKIENIRGQSLPRGDNLNIRQDVNITNKGNGITKSKDGITRRRRSRRSRRSTTARRITKTHKSRIPKGLDIIHKPKKRGISLKAIRGALRSPRTPPQLKKGLRRLLKQKSKHTHRKWSFHK